MRKRIFRTLLAAALVFSAFAANAVPAFAEGATVTGSDVNMRAGPGTNYDRLTVVRAGTAVSVLEYSGNFARVNADGWIGYVSQNYLK